MCGFLPCVLLRTGHSQALRVAGTNPAPRCHWHMAVWPCATQGEKNTSSAFGARQSSAKGLPEQHKHFPGTQRGGWSSGRDFFQVQRQRQPFQNKMLMLEHVVFLASNLKHHNHTLSNFSVDGFPRTLTNCLQRSASIHHWNTFSLLVESSCFPQLRSSDQAKGEEQYRNYWKTDRAF